MSLHYITILLSTTSPTETATTSHHTSAVTETISIVGRRSERAHRDVAGSVHVIDEANLDRFEYDDIQRVLNQVPGVYIRDEDGFGLRPNIGIRGASSERSAKVVLMEDGVLLGPAPYSAPAAYFVPLTTRMTGVEVSKGPAAIRVGPYTVGGAVNYLTAPIPEEGLQGHVDVAAGNFGYTKAHARLGWGGTYIGALLEGVRLRSTGFKELDGGGDTGFEKHEVMAKFRINTHPANSVFHRFELKAGWADELSNESYLGLTDEDFEANPYRRYRASSLANMDWERTQLQASYDLSAGEVMKVRVSAYRHEFDRAWFKLNLVGSRNDPIAARLPSQILDPSTRDSIGELQMQVLRGEIGSDISEQSNAGQLLIGTNARSFLSQGIQLDGTASIQLHSSLRQKLRFGARVHYDMIERNHTEDTYDMVVQGPDILGVLVRANVPRYTTLVNEESSTAFSAYISDEVQIAQKLTVSPGLRLEVIATDSQNTTDPSSIVQGSRSDTIWVPGLGLHYQLTSHLGLLAGAHRGFSPVSPGQSDEIKPESSTNYELGARFFGKDTSAEIIGYFNDYQNLLVTCTGSTGCQNEEIDRQFNAGSVLIYGFEALAKHRFALATGYTVDLSGQYTLSLSEFKEGFQSNQPQFEEVSVGDRLPYVPEHRASLTGVLSISFAGTIASLGVMYTFVDQMRDRASSGDIGEDDLESRDFTDIQHIVDISTQVDITEDSRVYLRVDNLLDYTYIASRRPFGARPGKPLTVQLGYTHRFNLY